jgi:hypothetical protein
MMNEGHTNRKQCFGFLKDWSETDVQRLLHHLVIEGYLAEDIHRYQGKYSFSYIRLGPWAELLTTNQVTIQFPIATGKRPLREGTTSRTANGFSYDCFSDLLKVVSGIAKKSNVVGGWNTLVHKNVRANLFIRKCKDKVRFWKLFLYLGS